MFSLTGRSTAEVEATVEVLHRGVRVASGAFASLTTAYEWSRAHAERAGWHFWWTPARLLAVASALILEERLGLMIDHEARSVHNCSRHWRTPAPMAATPGQLKSSSRVELLNSRRVGDKLRSVANNRKMSAASVSLERSEKERNSDVV
jgi:hypothetical protein